MLQQHQTNLGIGSINLHFKAFFKYDRSLFITTPRIHIHAVQTQFGQSASFQGFFFKYDRSPFITTPSIRIHAIMIHLYQM